MAKLIVPTKGNLLNLKRSNALAHVGYDLMDRKRNILIREMLGLSDKVRLLRKELVATYKEAYMALQEANITLGIVDDIAKAIPIDNGIKLTYRSVMGVEIPKVIYDSKPVRVTYGIGSTNTKFDIAYQKFQKVRDITLVLAEIDNQVYRLAHAIRRAQKRANALKNIAIPEFETNIRFIINALEEKDREEFSVKKLLKKKSVM